MIGALGEPTGQGWPQIGELAAALVLCSLIGLERQMRQKSAGLRTHTLVGLGAALFMLISKYGFTDVLVRGEVVLDPSRVAAQIVSGIGFVGGGLIFVRRDIVHGLTTAAVVWVVAGFLGAGGGHRTRRHRGHDRVGAAGGRPARCRPVGGHAGRTGRGAVGQRAGFG